MEAKKIILLLLLLVSNVHAIDFRFDDFRFAKRFSRKCSAVRRVPDGPGNFLVKNSDHGGHIVALTDTEISFDRVQMFRFRVRKNSEGKKRVSYRKLRNLTFTGRANGNRQHWRDYTRTLADLPRRRVLFRGRIQFVAAETVINPDTGEAEVVETTDAIFLCYVLSRVDRERND